MRMSYLFFPVTLLAAGCSPPATQEAKTDDMNMTAPAAPAAAGAITGAGAVTQVDAVAGTITINHGPIEAVGWPAMTMQFTAENPAILEGIAVGDAVSFELQSATETSVVTSVQKQ